MKQCTPRKNEYPTRIELDPRSRSRLNYQTLEFNSYNTAQLEQILEKRVEQAFRPGSVPDEVVTKIAEQVGEKSGDCREALQLLLRSGRAAERSGEDKLTIKSLEDL